MNDPIFWLKVIAGLLFTLTFMGAFSLAPWVPTRKSDIEKLLKIISVNKGEKFIELGCGTARVTLAFAKKYPKNQFTGIEFGFGFYLISWIKSKIISPKNTKIIWGNALHYDLSNYDIIYIFGMPDTITKKLLPKLSKELKPGARFYSYCMQMGENDIFTEKRIKGEGQQLALYEYIKK